MRSKVLSNLLHRSRALACIFYASWFACITLLALHPAEARAANTASATLRIDVTVVPTVQSPIAILPMSTANGGIVYSLPTVPTPTAMRQTSFRELPVQELERIPITSTTSSGESTAVLETLTFVAP